jgi:hypothetical protein
VRETQRNAPAVPARTAGLPVTIRRFSILLALALAAFAAALAVPATAAAAKPCWVRLVNDWYDGRIDKTYSVSCYRAAIKNLPDDVRAYSNAREEINRALLAAIKKGKRSGRTLTGSDLVPRQTGRLPGQTDNTPTGGGAPGGNTSTTGDEDPGDTSPTAGGGADEGGGPIGDVLKPANADSIPIPLLVLAGLALVLLAAASAGFVARRIQARRAGGPTLPREPEAP